MKFNSIFKTWDYSGIEEKKYAKLLNYFVDNNVHSGNAWKYIFWDENEERFAVGGRVYYSNENKNTEKLKEEGLVSLLSKLSQIEEVIVYFSFRNKNKKFKAHRIRLKLQGRMLDRFLSRGIIKDGVDNIIKLIDGVKSKKFIKILNAIENDRREHKRIEFGENLKMEENKLYFLMFLTDEETTLLREIENEFSKVI